MSTKTRKELKQAYQELKPAMGVFQIRNKTNGKVLIDGHRDMKARWNRHIAQLKFNSHDNTLLQQDWNMLGAGQFEFVVLSELKYDPLKTNYTKDIKELTAMYVEELNPSEEKGYN